ncbi:acyltransferase family protein [Bordetella sp. 2513F-2]
MSCNPLAQPSARERFVFMEGLRGLAAVQVVLLHYFAFFFPAFARVAGHGGQPWEAALAHTPLFFLIDGYTAVYLFFLMSGFVLASGFLHAAPAYGRQALKRFVRLYLPVAAAVLLALAWLGLLPEARTAAAALAGSGWAAGLYQNPLAAADIARELLLSSMLLGYQGTSLFGSLPFVSSKLAPVPHSTIPALWTLHIEFWGSLLTLMLVAGYRVMPRAAFWSAYACLLVITGTSAYTLFCLGFALYLHRRRLLESKGWLPAGIGYACLAGAVAVSAGGETGPVRHLVAAVGWALPGHVPSGAVLGAQVAAILVFLGVLLVPAVRRMLAQPVPAWLGGISFSLYLVHFPILFTLGAATFVMLQPQAGYLPAAALTALVYGFATTVVAIVFARTVDRPAILLARRWVARRRTANAPAMEAGEAPSTP